MKGKGRQLQAKTGITAKVKGRQQQRAKTRAKANAKGRQRRAKTKGSDKGKGEDKLEDKGKAMVKHNGKAIGKGKDQAMGKGKDNGMMSFFAVYGTHLAAIHGHTLGLDHFHKGRGEGKGMLLVCGKGLRLVSSNNVDDFLNDQVEVDHVYGGPLEDFVNRRVHDFFVKRRFHTREEEFVEKKFWNVEIDGAYDYSRETKLVVDGETKVGCYKWTSREGVSKVIDRGDTTIMVKSIEQEGEGAPM